MCIRDRPGRGDGSSLYDSDDSGEIRPHSPAAARAVFGVGIAGKGSRTAEKRSCFWRNVPSGANLPLCETVLGRRTGGIPEL